MVSETGCFGLDVWVFLWVLRFTCFDLCYFGWVWFDLCYCWCFWWFVVLHL